MMTWLFGYNWRLLATARVVLGWGVLMDFVLEVELSPKSWMLVEV